LGGLQAADLYLRGGAYLLLVLIAGLVLRDHGCDRAARLGALFAADARDPGGAGGVRPGL